MAMSHWLGYSLLIALVFLGIAEYPPDTCNTKEKHRGNSRILRAGYDKHPWDGNSKGWGVLKCPTWVIWVCIPVTLQNCFFGLFFPLYFLENGESPWGQATMYLFSVCFYSPRWRFVLQTEISGKYNSPFYFCFLLYFSFHSSCRKDQFIVLILKFDDA